MWSGGPGHWPAPRLRLRAGITVPSTDHPSWPSTPIGRHRASIVRDYRTGFLYTKISRRSPQASTQKMRPLSPLCISICMAVRLSMTYELTAVRGPCLGRCMYGRCAVYGGCGPRHRRCGPILRRGGPGSLTRGGRSRVSRARDRPGRGGASRARLFRARTRPPRARSDARRAARPPLMCYGFGSRQGWG